LCGFLVLMYINKWGDEMRVTITRGFHKGKVVTIKETNPTTNEMLVVDDNGDAFYVNAWELFMEVENDFFDIRTGERKTSKYDNSYVEEGVIL
jgi:predicted nucleotide-binding protein (sugar kinase/HSP70/actin superfamily)